MERLLGFDLQLLQDALISGINIFILFFALSYLLFQPAKELLEKRRSKITGDLEQADLVRTEAMTYKAEYEEKLKNIQKEADKILDHARDMAKERQHTILRDAQKEADTILERANQEITLEKQKAMEELKQELVGMSSMMACKAVAELLEEGLQRKLIEDTIRKIGERSWQS